MIRMEFTEQKFVDLMNARGHFSREGATELFKYYDNNDVAVSPALLETLWTEYFEDEAIEADYPDIMEEWEKEHPGHDFRAGKVMEQFTGVLRTDIPSWVIMGEF